MLSKLRIIPVLILLLLQSFTSVAQYEVTSNCLSAWEAIVDLRYNEADSIIKLELAVNPNNYYAYYLDQTAEAFRFMMNMSDSAYEIVNENFEKRMEIMEDKDRDSPYYNACIAEMNLQIGMFNIIYGDRLTGLRKAYKAYRKTYDNIEKFPDFNQSYKLDGIFNVAISNMPPFVGWAVKFFGVSGNFIKGYRIMNDYYINSLEIRGLNAEAALYNILAFKLNKDPQSACKFIGKLPDNIMKYELLKYFKGNVAYRESYNDTAMEIISSIPQVKDGFYFNGYNYMMGKILIRKLDTNCRAYFFEYLKNQKGLQYVKKVNYQITLTYLIEENFDQYHHYKEISKISGNDITERDRETSCDLDLDYELNPSLERAKLLIEGGYIDRAEVELKKLNNDPVVNTTPYSLQYTFLKGNFELVKHDTARAASYYKQVIDLGKDEDYSFACNDAFKLGLIYEVSDTDLALKYFNQAIDLWDSDYYENLRDVSKNKIELIEYRNGELE